MNDDLIPGVGHTLLHESIILNRYEVFRLALLYHANVDQLDARKITPLMKGIRK